MKNKNTEIYLSAVVRGADFAADEREFDFVITTDKRDSHGTVFESDGWDFEQYKENPVVFYQHQSHSDEPDNLVGLTVKGPYQEQLSDGSRGWIARVRFEDADVNAKAEKIRKKIIAGTLRMASIGANILAYRWGDPENGEQKDDLYFTKQRLFEWSIVNIGSNAGATLQRSKEFADQIRLDRVENTDLKYVRSLSAARLDLYKYQIK
tara:strand:- start:12346 stop:12969 length:624 start_codon:yes stop_codon:yes gene_type:complete